MNQVLGNSSLLLLDFIGIVVTILWMEFVGLIRKATDALMK